MKHLLRLSTLLIMVPLLIVGCYPSPDLTTSDLDVIITQFEKSHDFGADQTFSIADSVFVVETDNSIDLTGQFDDLILDLIKTNLENRGYTYVSPDDVENGTNVDFIMVVAKNGRETSGIFYGGCGGYYPGYPWGPGGGWLGPGWGYCPPYYGTYTYEEGTIMVSMLHPDWSESETELSGPWFGAINGLLSSNSAVNQTRITNNINRLFVQSPYFKAN